MGAFFKSNGRALVRTLLLCLFLLVVLASQSTMTSSSVLAPLEGLVFDKSRGGGGKELLLPVVRERASFLRGSAESFVTFAHDTRTSGY